MLDVADVVRWLGRQAAEAAAKANEFKCPAKVGKQHEWKRQFVGLGARSAEAHLSAGCFIPGIPASLPTRCRRSRITNVPSLFGRKVAVFYDAIASARSDGMLAQSLMAIPDLIMRDMSSFPCERIMA